MTIHTIHTTKHRRPWARTTAWLALVVGLVGCQTHRPPDTAVTRPVATAAATPTVEVIAFGSCARQDLPQPIWERVLDIEPDLFVLLGDNIYTDDTTDAETLAADYAKLAAHDGFARLRTTVPLLATWDDHDYGINDGGGENPHKVMFEHGFLDFFEVPHDAPQRTRPGVYSAQTFGPPGQRVQIILLDVRFFRGPLVRNPAGASVEHGRYVVSDDTTVTMLGDDQWRWLESTLREPADVRIIGSSIQVIANGHGWEKWGNLPHERQRLFQTIRDTGATGVVLLSGDRHLAELSMLPADDADGVGYPLYDLTASGLTHASTTLPPESNPHRVVTEGSIRAINFGVVRVNWSAPEPQVTFEVIGLDGEALLQETTPLARLRRSESR